MSFIFVYMYCLFMLDSLFLATMALGQIMLSFVPGILIYRFVFGYGELRAWAHGTCMCSCSM